MVGAWLRRSSKSSSVTHGRARILQISVLCARSVLCRRPLANIDLKLTLISEREAVFLRPPWCLHSSMLLSCIHRGIRRNLGLSVATWIFCSFPWRPWRIRNHRRMTKKWLDILFNNCIRGILNYNIFPESTISESRSLLIIFQFLKLKQSPKNDRWWKFCQWF